MNKDVIDTYKLSIITIVITIGRTIIVVSIPNVVAKVETVTPKRTIRFRG